MAPTAPARADDFLVTVAHDDGDGVCVPDECTLREALSEAGANDTVFLPPGAYELADGQLVLDGDRLVGGGARTTSILGDGLERVLLVASGANEITGVTITGGDVPSAPPTGTGGGVAVTGANTSLTISDSTVSGNDANDGGGLANFGGTLTVVRSTVTDNVASDATFSGHGGGIWTAGTTTISNSTISGNRASAGEAFSEGAGVYVVGGTLAVENSTIAANTSMFGDAIQGSSQAPAIVTLSHTIVAGGPTACANVTIEGSHNVIDSAACGTAVADAQLAPLGDNGGPTDTHAIGAGSPAVNAGVSCDTTDQRGVARVGACDIGAFESDVLTTVVTTTSDHEPNGCTPQDCTLREAIEDSQASDIEVPPGDYVLQRGELAATRTMAIRGTGADLPTIRPDVEFPSRVMYVGGDSAVRLSRLRISDGDNAGGSGGGIFVDSAAILTLADSEIVGNEAASGAGIWSDGTLRVDRSLIALNVAEGGNGGGIGLSLDSDPVTLTNTTLSGNRTDGFGGGIFTQRSMTLANVSIVENEAPPRDVAGLHGGGLYQQFSPGSQLRTVAVNALLVRNAGGGCGGTADEFFIDSTNGMLDEVDDIPAPGTCNAVGDGNVVTGDALIGPLAANGGPTRTHALLSGSPAIDAGAAQCPPDDQRGVSRPRGAACDVGAYEHVPPSPPPSPPPDTGGGGGGTQPPPDEEDEQQLPPPVAGKSLNALPKSGTVKIKLPGSNRFVELGEGAQIPVGTVVDARKGRVTLVAAANRNGGTATADFYSGIFKIGQTHGSKPITTLTLIEKLSCPKAGKANAAAKKRKRRLWGDGQGRFRTKGSYSSATVRGTKWLTEDTCTTTLTRVSKGSVTVRDLVKRKNVVVKAGKKYVARRRA